MCGVIIPGMCGLSRVYTPGVGIFMNPTTIAALHWDVKGCHSVERQRVFGTAAISLDCTGTVGKRAAGCHNNALYTLTLTLTRGTW